MGVCLYIWRYGGKYTLHRLTWSLPLLWIPEVNRAVSLLSFLKQSLLLILQVNRTGRAGGGSGKGQSNFNTTLPAAAVHSLSTPALVAHPAVNPLEKVARMLNICLELGVIGGTGLSQLLLMSIEY